MLNMLIKRRKKEKKLKNLFYPFLRNVSVKN